MKILAIDPGTVQSGFVVYDPAGPVLDLGAAVPLRRGTVLEHGVAPNAELLARCWRDGQSVPSLPSEYVLVVEMINVFGPAGATVYRTCWWIGRFAEAWGELGYNEITRHDVKHHLCRTSRAGDSDVRAALIERWGGEMLAIGAKGKGKARTAPGPLHGVATHAWQALGCAVTWADLREQAQQRAAMEPAQNGAA